MALDTKDAKPGTAVVIAGRSGQWELLDKHPKPAHWWLHRWTAEGVWQSTYEHQRDLRKVADGSRHEFTQPELEIAA